jgi:hypothetical protein
LQYQNGGLQNVELKIRSRAFTHCTYRKQIAQGNQGEDTVIEVIGRRIELHPRVGERGAILGSLGFGREPDSRFVARRDELLAIDFCE